MKKLKRFVWIPLLLILAIAGVVVYSRTQSQKRINAIANAQTVALTTGEVSSTVSGTGSVYANQIATLTWNTTGQVDQVLVKEGDEVKEDQILASLKYSSLPSNSAILAAKASLETDQNALEDLKNSNVKLAAAQQTLAAKQAALTKAKRNRSYKNSTTRGSEADIALAKANYEIAQQDVDGLQGYYSVVADKDSNDNKYIKAVTQLAAAEKYRDEMYNNWAYLSGAWSAKEIADADAVVVTAQAEYDDALRTYNRLKAGPTAEEIAAAENAIKADEEWIDSVNLKAPFDGTVVEVNIYDNESIYGYTAAQLKDTSLQKHAVTQAMIIEDLSKVFIDVSVSEININSVKEGQTATVTFDAVPGETYQGKVTQVGQVGSTSNASVSYKVTVQIDNADRKLKMGMTGTAKIIISQNSNALLAPTKAIVTRRQTQQVYVVRNGQAVGIAVQTGSVVGDQTEIISNVLKAGDQVIADASTLNTNNSELTRLLERMTGGPGAGGPPPGSRGPGAGAPSGGNFGGNSGNPGGGSR